jgi:PAS domain-containing protein
VSSGEPFSEVVEENVVLRSVLREQLKLHGALRHLHDRLRTLLATVPGVLYSLRPDGRLDYISPSVEGLLGKPDTWYLGDASRFLDHVHPNDLGRVYHWHLQLLYAEAPCESQLQYHVLHDDGPVIEVLDRASAVFEGGELARVDGLIVVVQRAVVPRPHDAAHAHAP